MAQGDKERTVNLAHARSDFQRGVMEQIERDGVCPFCREHFLKYHTKPIIRQTGHWILTENFQPYAGSTCHLLAVSIRHAQHFDMIGSEAQAELFALFSEELRKRGVAGGTIFMRFGDTDYTGGTVEHLHAHAVSGVKGKKGDEPLLTMIAYKKGA